MPESAGDRANNFIIEMLMGALYGEVQFAKSEGKSLDDGLRKFCSMIVSRMLDVEMHEPQDVINMLGALPTDDARKEWLDQVTAAVCKNCGSLTGNKCTCCNDE